jgi:hypothetical protein
MYKRSISKAVYIAMILLIITASFMGCEASKPLPPGPNPPSYAPSPVGPITDLQTQPPEPVHEKIEGYIPLKVGSKWVYEGRGSDMATYTQEVINNKGNRYQIRTIAGNTVTTNIFEVREDNIANVLMSRDGKNKNLLNEPDTADIIFLKLPIAVGNKWSSQQNTYEIIQTNAKVKVPYGTFDNCVVVRLDFFDGSTSLLYYKKGIGMLLSEFTTNRDTIVSRLKSFTSK